MDLFLESQAEALEEIWLDLDATDDPTHGQQEGRFYHGYYREHCYLPLYIFCEHHALCARTAGFCRDGILSWCKTTAKPWGRTICNLR